MMHGPLGSAVRACLSLELVQQRHSSAHLWHTRLMHVATCLSHVDHAGYSSTDQFCASFRKTWTPVCFLRGAVLASTAICLQSAQDLQTVVVIVNSRYWEVSKSYYHVFILHGWVVESYQLSVCHCPCASLAGSCGKENDEYQNICTGLHASYNGQELFWQLTCLCLYTATTLLLFARFVLFCGAMHWCMTMMN